MGDETTIMGYMGGCQNYGPFLDPYYSTAPNILGYPKRDHNFDNHQYESAIAEGAGATINRDLDVAACSIPPE